MYVLRFIRFGVNVKVVRFHWMYTWNIFLRNITCGKVEEASLPRNSRTTWKQRTSLRKTTACRNASKCWRRTFGFTSPKSDEDAGIDWNFMSGYFFSSIPLSFTKFSSVCVCCKECFFSLKNCYDSDILCSFLTTNWTTSSPVMVSSLKQDRFVTTKML